MTVTADNTEAKRDSAYSLNDNGIAKTIEASENRDLSSVTVVKRYSDDVSRVNGSATNSSSICNQQEQKEQEEEEERSRFLTSQKVSRIDSTLNASTKSRKISNSDEQTPIHASWAQEDVENGRNEMVTDIELVPPDGGVRAWMIMIGSFVINGILFSVINTYSLMYLELQKRLIAAGETEASSKAALVGSLTIGTTFFLSPIAGILTDKIGIQMTTFLGGAIASSGMLLSSMLAHKVEFLYLTYGVMYGLGASLAYTPSLAILGHYFKKYLGLVNGIVTAGSSIFTMLMPYLIEVLLRHFGLEGALRTLALLTGVIMLCAVLFKPIPHTPTTRLEYQPESGFRHRLKKVVNLSIWKKKRYVVWASSIPLALFGYFVPYVHIGKFVETVFKNADGKLPVMCIGITSGVGRLVFGYIADLPRVNRILLQQISFISIGVLTMLLPVTPSFVVLLVISLGMGLFDGCFISLLGPIAFDICGREGATQAIGFLLGMCSIPLTVGPPIAGLLYDHTGSYNLPFLLAGLPPIVGALTMFLIKCVKEPNTEGTSDTIADDSVSKVNCQNEKAKNALLSSSFATIASGCAPRRQRSMSNKCRSMQFLYESGKSLKYQDDDSEELKYSSCMETIPLLHGKY